MNFFVQLPVNFVSFTKELPDFSLWGVKLRFLPCEIGSWSGTKLLSRISLRLPSISRVLDERRRRQGSCSPLCEQWRSLMLLCSKISKFLGVMLFYWWIRCSDAGYSAPNPIWVAYLIWNQIYPFLTEVANNLPLCLELRTFRTTSLLFVWCKLEAKNQILFYRRVFNFRIGSIIWLL